LLLVAGQVLVVEVLVVAVALEVYLQAMQELLLVLLTL